MGSCDVGQRCPVSVEAGEAERRSLGDSTDDVLGFRGGWREAYRQSSSCEERDDPFKSCSLDADVMESGDLGVVGDSVKRC